MQCKSQGAQKNVMKQQDKDNNASYADWEKKIQWRYFFSPKFQSGWASDKISSSFLTTANTKYFCPLLRFCCDLWRAPAFVGAERVSCDDANKLVNCISLLAALLGFGADLLWAVECVHHADWWKGAGWLAGCMRSDLPFSLVDLYIKQIDFQIYLLPASARGAHDAEGIFLCRCVRRNLWSEAPLFNYFRQSLQRRSLFALSRAQIREGRAAAFCHNTKCCCARPEHAEGNANKYSRYTPDDEMRQAPSLPMAESVNDIRDIHFAAWQRC